MKRIVLLLIVASVVMFAVALKTPLRTIRSLIPYPEVEQSPQPEKTADAKSAKRDDYRKTPGTVARQWAEADDHRTPDTKPVVATATPKQSASARRSASSASLGGQATLSNPAPLYAINSTHGSVMSVLTTGTVVEPNLQVMDVNGSWTLVRVPGLNTMGFVRTEDLAAPQ